MSGEVGLDGVDEVGTEWKIPRRIALSVSWAKKISTMFSHELEVGVKWNSNRGWPREPGLHLGVVVGGVVIEDEMNVEAFGDLTVDRLEKPEELDVAMTREALADHRPGEDIQRREQCRGPVALVVMGHRPGAPRLHRHDG